MLSLGELSLFLPDEVYLAKKDPVLPFVAPNKSIPKAIVVEEEEESEEEEVVEQATPTKEVAPQYPLQYPSVLFVVDKPLTGLADETFKNLVNKGLALGEKDFEVIPQEKVNFTKPAEVTSKKIVLFGVPFSGFQTKYKINSSEKQLVLLADPMDKIAETVDLKRQLWAARQLMFPHN